MKMKFMWMLTLATFSLASTYAQNVDEIVAKHIAALGGADKLKGVTTISNERTVAVQGMEIPNSSILVVGKALRTESTVMGNAMVQVVKEGKGWKIMPSMMGGSGEPEDLTAEELKQLDGQMDPFGVLYMYQEKGNKVEFVGNEKVDKKDMIHLKISTKGGAIVDEYLDATTFLAYKVISRMDGQEAEIIFSNYEEVEGIKFPNTMDMTTGMGSFTIITNKTTINSPVDEQVFAKPAK